MSNQPPGQTATLAVLAGGRGSRMGRPKDRLRIDRKPVLHYLLDRIQWPGPTLLVTAPGAPMMNGSERFTSVASDPVEGEGPLRGVLTATGACTTELLLIATVDMPAWDADKLLLLIEKLAQSDALGAMFSRGRTIEPFPLALRRSGYSDIADKFSAGERSTRALSNDRRYAVLAAPTDWPVITWTNLNRPADVRAFGKALSPQQ